MALFLQHLTSIQFSSSIDLSEQRRSRQAAEHFRETQGARWCSHKTNYNFMLTVALSLSPLFCSLPSGLYQRRGHCKQNLSCLFCLHVGILDIPERGAFRES